MISPALESTLIQLLGREIGRNSSQELRLPWWHVFQIQRLRHTSRPKTAVRVDFESGHILLSHSNVHVGKASQGQLMVMYEYSKLFSLSDRLTNETWVPPMIKYGVPTSACKSLLLLLPAMVHTKSDSTTTIAAIISKEQRQYHAQAPIFETAISATRWER